LANHHLQDKRVHVETGDVLATLSSQARSQTWFGIRTSSLNMAIYPAGGVEASLGPVGLRFELRDDIYFNNGAHNNLRITFGPILRF
jgi:hypothetical protein